MSRPIGVLVVVLALAAAIGAPAGSLAAGAARPEPMPPEPSAGECYRGAVPVGPEVPPAVFVLPRPGGVRVPDSPERPDAPDDASGADGVGFSEDTWSPFGACTGVIGGQVAMIARARGDLDDRLQVASTLTPDCARAIRRMSGADVAERAVAATAGIRWTLSVNARPHWVVPDPRARAAGQTWLACVARPPFPTAYRGSIVRAFDGGRPPDQFGTCWAEVEITASITAVPCAGPHASELIALGSIPRPEGLSSREVVADCAAFAARVIGRDDPTADGALAVRLHPGGLDGRLSEGAGIDVVCSVSGQEDEAITGTVIGLADRAVRFG